MVNEDEIVLMVGTNSQHYAGFFVVLLVLEE